MQNYIAKKTRKSIFQLLFLQNKSKTT